MKYSELRGGSEYSCGVQETQLRNECTHLLVKRASSELGIETRKRLADTFEGVVEAAAQSKRADRAAYCHS